MAEAGFDYLEAGASEIAAAEPFDPEAFRQANVIRTNLFFAGGMHLSQPREEILAYAKKAVDRAARIGVEVMVIGSGGARRALEGEAQPEAEKRFIDVVASIAEYARQNRIRIAPESLLKAETNVGNDLADLARRLAQRGVGYTADSYHILMEAGPDVDWEAQISTLPDHVHIGDAPARRWPSATDPQMIAFANRLKHLGYNGSVSVEAKRAGDTVADFREILQNLQALFA